MNQTSGEVQCGICGVIRFYKSIVKTKKYGAYSCDSCRKFIAKYIEKQNTFNRCNNERGITCIFTLIFLYLSLFFFFRYRSVSYSKWAEFSKWDYKNCIS